MIHFNIGFPGKEQLLPMEDDVCCSLSLLSSLFSLSLSLSLSLSVPLTYFYFSDIKPFELLPMDDMNVPFNTEERQVRSSMFEK